MLRDENGRPASMFKTLRTLHGTNLDTSGLNDLTEAFSNFVTRARFFSVSLRRTLSHSAVEFLRYRRRLPALVSASNEKDGSGHSSLSSPDDSIASSCRIFVSNISFRVTERQLASFFSKFGKVKSCSVPQEGGHGTLGRMRSRGIGFVTFSKPDEAIRALSAIPDDLTYYGRQMAVASFQPSKERPKQLKPTAVTPPPSPSGSWADGGSENFEESPILDLPDNLLIDIFVFLSIKQRIRIERVCKKFLEISYKSWFKIPELRLNNMGFSIWSGKPLTPGIFKSILRHSGASLRVLDVRGDASHCLDERCLIDAGRLCPNLSEVHLTGLRVGWKGLRGLAEGCKLTILHFERANLVGERGWWWLLKNSPNLRELIIPQCRKLTGKCFQQLSIGCENVDLSGCVKLTVEGIEELSRCGLGLKSLSVRDCQLLNDDAISHICRLSGLTKLNISGRCMNNLSSDGLSLLKHLRNLRELNLSELSNLNDLVLEQICEGCRYLQKLSIQSAGRRNPLTEQGLMIIAALRELSILDLSYLSGATDSVVISLSTALPKLASLMLRGCNKIGNAAAQALFTNASNLNYLDISGILLINNGAFQHVAAFNRRLHVVVGGTSIDILNLPAIENLVLDPADLNRPNLLPGAEHDMNLYYESTADEASSDDESDIMDQSFVLDEIGYESDANPAVIEEPELG